MEYENDSLSHILKTTAMESFISLLKKIEGSKDLILSSNLITTLDLICGFATLKANGVERIFKLQSGIFDYGSTLKRCFVIRPNLIETKLVANCINEEKQRDNSNIEYSIIFVPRMSYICDQCLEQEGVYNYIKIFDYPLGLIPLDTDLFSLEMNDFFVDCFLNGDQSSLRHICDSIDQFEKLFGQFQNLYGKGKYASMVNDMRSFIEDNDLNKVSMIRNIILFDRDCDYASVLLSQLNYEGLLDETFSIKCGKVEFGSEVIKSGDKTVKHPVHSNDPIYSDIRDKAFSSVFASLKEKGQKMRKNIDKSQSMNITAMKDFVANELKSLQSQYKSLCLHISACEVIMERKKEVEFADQLRIEQNMIEGIESKGCLNFIEENIIRQISHLTSLRLISLYSYTNDGLSNSVYKNLVSLFLQSFGHDFIVALFNLKKLGIFRDNVNNQISSPNQIFNSKPNIGFANKVTAAMSSSTIQNRKFRGMIKRLNLIPQINDGVYDIKNAPDAGFVFGGAFIPVICRMIELLLVNKNANIEDLLRYIPGESVNSSRNVNYSSSSETVLVYFIGGVTYAEVSALRFVAEKKGIHLIIATTSVINGNNFVNQLMPQI